MVVDACDHGTSFSLEVFQHPNYQLTVALEPPKERELDGERHPSALAFEPHVQSDSRFGIDTGKSREKLAGGELQQNTESGHGKSRALQPYL
jgi:hypothetical protein